MEAYIPYKPQRRAGTDHSYGSTITMYEPVEALAKCPECGYEVDPDRIDELSGLCLRCVRDTEKEFLQFYYNLSAGQKACVRALVAEQDM